MCVHKMVYLAWKNELDLIELSISIVYCISYDIVSPHNESFNSGFDDI